MRKRFHQSLDELKEKLLVMAGFSEQAIQRAIEAYRTRDGEMVELVRKSEPSINRLEREIDSTALDLLATEQPMAVDLRFILSVIRINADLERVGDLAVNIAIRVGETMDVAAILTEPVKTGDMLMLMVHGEDGGNLVGNFEYTLGAKEDGPVKVDGKLVMTVVTVK